MLAFHGQHLLKGDIIPESCSPHDHIRGDKGRKPSVISSQWAGLPQPELHASVLNRAFLLL